MKGVGWGNAEPKPAPRTPCVITDADVLRVLSGRRFNLTAEHLTCNEIEAVLVEAFGEDQVSREHRLSPGDRPDFLIGGCVVLEVKGPRHTAIAVLRQLERYAQHEQVTAIVLATSRAMPMPRAFWFGENREARHVDVTVLNLGRAWL